MAPHLQCFDISISVSTKYKAVDTSVNFVMKKLWADKFLLFRTLLTSTYSIGTSYQHYNVIVYFYYKYIKKNKVLNNNY